MLQWALSKKTFIALIILSLCAFACIGLGSESSLYAQTQTDSSFIDPRISTAHLSGKYPKFEAEYLVSGAKEARELGFQSIEIFLHPAICWADNSKQKGIYQTVDWCRHTEPYGPEPTTLANSLTELASHPRYKEFFALPFKTVLVTAETIRKKNGSNYFLQIAFNEFTPEELDALYKDFYDLTIHLLSTYKKSGKTIILQTPNEMDWSMLGTFDTTKTPTPLAIKNATSYWNTIQNAVNDAKNTIPEDGIKVYHGCELNLAQKAMKGATTVTNDVLPNTHCDLYGYSAYDTVLMNVSNSADTSSLTKALDYIASKAPDSKDFGNKNIYISEIGIAERPYLTIDTGLLLTKYISQALSWGTPLVNTWALYDNECTVYLPTSNDSCPGYWVKKPDGSLSNTFQNIKAKFTIIPTPTLTTNRQALSCDPNKDGEVNQQDFQYWKDELIGEKTTKLTDCFHSDGVVDLLDFQVWKDIAISRVRVPF